MVGVGAVIIALPVLVEIVEVRRIVVAVPLTVAVEAVEKILVYSGSPM